MGTGVGRVGPIAHAAHNADWLLAKLDDLGDHEVDRHQPSAGLPVVGAFALERERPGLRCRIGDERLQVCLVEIGAIGIARKGPDVVGENAERPAAALPNKNSGRARAPFLSAEQLIGSGRQQKDRAYPQVKPLNVRLGEK
jgi:hypothetical protein